MIALRRAIVGRIPIWMRKVLRRAPLILLAKVNRWRSRPWAALDAAEWAVRFRSAYDPMVVKVLLQALRDAPCSPHWHGFFDRAEPPGILGLRYDQAITELLDYLDEFCRAVIACEDLQCSSNPYAVRIFPHHWWKVYRHDDSRIGRFAAYGNSDQSQEIGALRHVIEFACYRTLARTVGRVDVDGPEWRSECCNLALALEKHVSQSDLPVLLLSAGYLASMDRLDEARDRAYRCLNLNSRCLITQHLLDAVEQAIDLRSRHLPYSFSLLEEAPRRFAGKFCPIPFDNTYINPDGDTFLCCSTILPVPVGNVFREQSWNDVWNSKIAQEVRGSILDGTYKYCNKRSCPAILNDTLIGADELLNRAQTGRQERWQQAIRNKSVAMKGPSFADLGYDISCNLSCPQCRLDLIVLDRPGAAKLDALREGMIDSLLGELETVCISSGGEALFSRHFRRLLADLSRTRCPNLKHLQLLTNGMLFDHRQWETFCNLHYLDIFLTVSIDASSKEVFESIRRNAGSGCWPTWSLRALCERKVGLPISRCHTPFKRRTFAICAEQCTWHKGWVSTSWIFQAREYWNLRRG